MGLFKKIKKMGKKVLKGAKKVFKKGMKLVGKIAGSKWGKALMIAGAVVMGGIAIYGAMQGVASAGAGATFMGKFAAGAKGMMGALANPVTTGKGMLSKAAGAMGTTAPGTGAVAQGVAGFNELGQIAATPLGEAVTTGAGTGVGAGGGGVLSKVGAGVLDFAKSAGGGQMLSGAVQGFAEGKAAEDQREWEEQQKRYYDNAWQDQGAVEGFHAATAAPAGSAPYAGALSRAQGGQPTNYVPGSREDKVAFARGY